MIIINFVKKNPIKRAVKTTYKNYQYWTFLTLEENDNILHINDKIKVSIQRYSWRLAIAILSWTFSLLFPVTYGL